MNKMQSILPVFALAPDADRYNSDPATDIINMGDYAHIDFFIMEGAGGTGTATVTMHSSDDVSASNTTAIGFRYRVAQTADTFGVWTTVAANYLLIAGANKMVQIQVDADQLADGEPYVRMTLTEAVDSPVDAGVLAILSGVRYGQEQPATALV